MIALDLSPLVLDPRRGVSRALRHLLQGLREVPRAGLAVVGFVPAAERPAPGWAAAELGLDAVEVVRIPSLRPGPWRRALGRALERAGARVLLSPWAAFPRTHVPVVAWIHEVPFARHGALEGTLRTLRHRRALARAVERAAALVVPADAVRADLLSLHPQARARTHVVPHGFDADRWSVNHLGCFTTTTLLIDTCPPIGPLAATPTGREPWLPSRPYALLVGTGRGAGGPRKKGVDVFARAFAAGAVAGLEALVVGTAPGLSEHVREVREVGDARLAVLVRGARVVVVPSRSEGFGYPVLEAFAAGVPVVASAAGALPEVSGGAARLVPPGDADALREALERVATDEDLRTSMIEAGRRRALEFPVAAMARGWLRVLTAAGGIPWRG